MEIPPLSASNPTFEAALGSGPLGFLVTRFSDKTSTARPDPESPPVPVRRAFLARALTSLASCCLALALAAVASLCRRSVAAFARRLASSDLYVPSPPCPGVDAPSRRRAVPPVARHRGGSACPCPFPMIPLSHSSCLPRIAGQAVAPCSSPV